MGLVAAKCPNCGADFEVELDSKAGICKYCGAPFITQDAIINYNTTIVNNNNITNNINAGNINILSGKEEHFMKLAEDAYECNDWETVEVNTAKALEINPDNVRATLLQGLAVAASSECSTTNSKLKLNKLYGAYKRVFLTNKSDLSTVAIFNYLVDLVDMARGICRLAESVYNPVWSDYLSAYMVWHVYGESITIMELALEIADKYEIKEKHVKGYKSILMAYQNLLIGILERREYDTHVTGGAIDVKKIYIDNWGFYNIKYENNTKRIKEIDPSYSAKDMKMGGCYIATCVYGSYDCSQVWTLRRFRDNKLDKTAFGRLFIKYYYRYSPRLVAKYGQKEWFVRLWKSYLDKRVNKLRSKGYEDTPYSDKY